MPPAARVGDMHTCPLVNPGPVPHVGGPILPPGMPTVLIGGMPAARQGDMCTCVGPPDVIAMGSPTVLIGGMMAARQGDPTAHGGVIVIGFPTVLIGIPAAGAGGGAGAGGAAGIGGAAAGTNLPPYHDDLMKEMKKAWAESFNADGTVTEQGGYIVKTKDGKYEVRRVPPGASGEILVPRANEMKDGETLVGTWHTHPYSEEEGGHTGVSFSKGDINNFLEGEQGDVKYVYAGDKVFKMEMTDRDKATKSDPDDVSEKWDETFADADGDLPEKADQATEEATKDTGVEYTKFDP